MDDYREVNYKKYCETCVRKKCPETDETCDYCLDHPINEYTDRPVNYEEKK